MSKQIQIRRGTATENNNFTGAIGEITMDTTNNTLRVHDGTTAGGTVLAKQSEIPAPYTMPSNYDFVVEYQEPTSANNYTWYRKYKSGWVEQGGRQTGNVSITSGTSGNLGEITLPVVMADTRYFATATGDENVFLIRNTMNTNSITFRFGAYSSTTRTLTYVRWYVCGKSA